MASRTYTVAFEGLEARLVEVQCAAVPGLPHLSVVGLADKAVSEARERVRAALTSLGIALPNKRITINLSPADLPKEGPHFDLALALAMLAEIDLLPRDAVEGVVALGELSLDGRLMPVTGAMPAALRAAAVEKTLICPTGSGGEAAWIGAAEVLVAPHLREILRHFSGQQLLSPPKPAPLAPEATRPDMRELRGQERARRGLEIAAAGGHHLLMVGPPGSGKTMLAQRLPSLLPPLTPSEALETSLIRSLAGDLRDGRISLQRPFRAPHHSATVAALTGGARNARPGEVSLAHNGVLFLDELPEFPRASLEALRQPLENGDVTVSRAHAHVTYPCRLLLVAAANPCRCGHLADASRACARAPLCGADYMRRLSGPLIDRFDMHFEVPAVSLRELSDLPQGEASQPIATRVAAARQIQAQRYAQNTARNLNGQATGSILEDVSRPDAKGLELLHRAAEHFGFSARGYHRVLRVARTIADLEGSDTVAAPHIAEAVSFRTPTGHDTG